MWRKKGFHFQLCLLPCRQKGGRAKRDVYKVELGEGESHWLSACQGRDQNMCVYRDILSPRWNHSFSLHPTFPPNIHFEYHCLVQGAFCNSENIFFDVKKWKTMLGNIQIFQIFQGILAIIFQKMWNCLLLSRLINKITYWKELNFVFMLEHWTINRCWIFLNNQRSRTYLLAVTMRKYIDSFDYLYWLAQWFMLNNELWYDFLGRSDIVVRFHC